MRRKPRFDEAVTLVQVIKMFQPMFQPPCDGGSFFARLDTAVPQSIA